MTRNAWLLLGAGAVAVFVWYTKRQHPIIAGPGYPSHLTTFGEAFKIAFGLARYPEPLRGAPGTVLDVETGAVVPVRTASFVSGVTFDAGMARAQGVSEDEIALRLRDRSGVPGMLA